MARKSQDIGLPMPSNLEVALASVLPMHLSRIVLTVKVDKVDVPVYQRGGKVADECRTQSRNLPQLLAVHACEHRLPADEHHATGLWDCDEVEPGRVHSMYLSSELIVLGYTWHTKHFEAAAQVEQRVDAQYDPEA